MSNIVCFDFLGNLEFFTEERGKGKIGNLVSKGYYKTNQLSICRKAYIEGTTMQVVDINATIAMINFNF